MNNSEAKATYYMIPFIWNAKIGKATETESRLAIAWGWGELWAMGVIAEGCMISLEDKKNILKLMVVIVAQLVSILKTI